MNISDTKTRTEASPEEIVDILECETYSKEFIERAVKALGKEKADAKDILSAQHVDVDSRLHAFFSLKFMSDKESVSAALDFIGQMLYLLDGKPELKTEAENALASLRNMLDGDQGVDMNALESKLRALYEQTYQTKEGVVFEAFVKLFVVEAGKLAETVAGSARSAALWTAADQNNEKLVEQERSSIAEKQAEHLVSLC